MIFTACPEEDEFPPYPVSYTAELVLSQKAAYAFTPVEAGYSAPPERDIVITNTKRLATGRVTINLSGPNAESFTVTPESIPSIEGGGEAMFTVKPKPNLSIGSYAARVTVTGENDVEAGFNVSFTVFGVIHVDSLGPASAAQGWDWNGSDTYTLVDGANVTIDGITTSRRIEVAPNARVKLTLRNTSITSPGGGGAVQLNAGSRAEISLIGATSLTGASGFAGLQVAHTAEVTLRGTGSLTAVGGANGAGIGGGNSGDCGGIIIQQGTITATGSGGGAGIGGGSGGNNGSILIQAGNVTATGSGGGSGIGGGSGGTGGTITIKSGTVTALGSTSGAGIGGGQGQGGGIIKIEAGETISAGGAGAAGIGGGAGAGGVGGNITISGGRILTTSGQDGAGLGGGNGASGGTITITGGQILAGSNVLNSLGIGPGGGAGIGGGNGGSGGDVKIQGGTVVAIKSASGSGIGDGQSGSGGTFTTGGGGGNPLIKPVVFTGSISDISTDAASLTPANGILGALVITARQYLGKIDVVSITLTSSFTVPAGAALELEYPSEISITASVSVTNYGRIINRIPLNINNSILTNHGKFENYYSLSDCNTLDNYGHFVNHSGGGGVDMKTGGTALNNYGKFENYSYVWLSGCSVVYGDWTGNDPNP